MNGDYSLLTYVIIWYFSAYSFEIGYFLYFDIPITLIDISLNNLISLGFSVSTIIAILAIFYYTQIVPIIKNNWHKNKKTISVLHILIIGCPIAYFSEKNIYIMLIWLWMPLFIWHGVFFDDKENYNRENKTVTNTIAIGAKFSIIAFSALITSTTAGYIYAVNKKSFLRTESHIILNMRGNSAIATTEINQKNQIIKIINLDGQKILHHKQK